MGLFETAAATALASSGVFLFMTVLLIAAAKRTSTCIGLFSVQSLILTAQVITASRMHHSTEGFVIAAMVLTVKVIAIPYVLYRIVEELQAPRDVSSSTSSSQSVFIAAGLILLSIFAVRPYAGVLGGDQSMLAASVALVLTGGFLMISRKKALMQVVGLLVLDNGVFLAALTTTFSMPLVIEIGIVFDLLMGVFLMGLFVFRIRDTFNHVDVSKLRRLRG
jgi:hydrogenase-4 component E